MSLNLDGGSAPLLANTERSLRNIEDALSVILQCGNRLPNIQSVLLPALNKLSSNAAHQLASPIEGDKDPITLLKPDQHTLGMIYILQAQVANAATPEAANALLPSLHLLVQGIDVAQAQLAGPKLVQLARGIQDLGTLLGNPAITLPTLTTLFLALTIDHPEALTPFHAILAYEHLKLSDYDAASQLILNQDLVDVDPHYSPRYTDVLEYYYYTGMLLIKMRRLSEAIDALETCVSSPAASASAIQVDAYKKLLLVQLLAHGKTSSPPKYASGVLMRSFKHLGAAYTAFATAYESRDASCVAQLERIVNEKSEVFAQDCNFGLIYQCLELHRQRRIQRLASVYSTLSIADIAKAVGAEGAEADVLADVQQLIAKGWLSATIEPQGVVRFLASPQTYDDTATIERLNASIKAAQKWQSITHCRERELVRSAEFLKKQATASQRGDRRFMSFGGGEDYEDELLAA